MYLLILNLNNNKLLHGNCLLNCFMDLQTHTQIAFSILCEILLCLFPTYFPEKSRYLNGKKNKIIRYKNIILFSSHVHFLSFFGSLLSFLIIVIKFSILQIFTHACFGLELLIVVDRTIFFTYEMKLKCL